MQLPGLSPEPTPLSGTTQPWATALREQFLDVRLYAQTLIVLLVAVVLGAVLAYHPSLRRKVASRAELEQPKTMIMYALVGALVGHIVSLNPTMALVIFGIGGLLRFRTIVGEAKDTGRVILAAIVGIGCGMQTYLIAVLATVAAWLIVWQLEREVIGSVQILGLSVPQMEAASRAYRKLLGDADCKVVSERRNSKKGELEFVFRAPGRVTVEQLTERTHGLDEDQRGVAAWEIS